MILADKIIALRKKNGWSQEELAEKINVSRQAVSKWEGAQTVPDLDKILLLSQAFGVTLDYLVKDELVEEEYVQASDEDVPPVRKVSMEDANEFLKISNKNAPRIALGVMLCIFSPITLLVLCGAADMGIVKMTEDAAAGIGLATLITLVAIAVGLFVSAGARSKDFEFLEKERIETAYGVSGMVKERERAYRNTYNMHNVIGTVLCVLSVLPLFLSIAITKNEFAYIASVGILLALVGIGNYLFVSAGCTHGAMDKLLQEGDYSKEKKELNAKTEPISGIYWTVVIGGYLAWSFISNDWNITWIIWPVAGVLYAAVRGVFDLVTSGKKQ